MSPRQNEVAFVEHGSHGAVLAELAGSPLDNIALVVRGGVEGGCGCDASSWDLAHISGPDPRSQTRP